MAKKGKSKLYIFGRHGEILVTAEQEFEQNFSMSNCPWCNRWLWPLKEPKHHSLLLRSTSSSGRSYWQQYTTSNHLFTSYFPPTVKKWHLYLSQEAPPTGAPLSFKSKGMVTFPKWDTSPSSVTLRHFVRPPWQFTGTHLYSWVERSTVSRSKVSCLGTQLYNLTWSQT